MKFTFAFALSAVALASAVSARADEATLRAATFTTINTTWGAPFKLFADHVNEVGKGEVKIDIIGPEALPATEQPNALRDGLIDIAVTVPGHYKQIVPEANAQDLSNMLLEEQRASGGYALLQDVIRQKLGAEMLTSYGPGVKFHLYLTEDIASAADLDGMRIRSQPLFNPFLAALGVSPMTLPIPDVYTALERGVVQGYAFPAWGIQDLGWDKMTRVRVEPGFYNVVVNVMMNEARWQGLTQAQRKVLTDSVAWFETTMQGYMADLSEQNAAAQDAAGIKAVDLGADFATRASDVYWDELEKISPDAIPALRAKLMK
ncbi:ABC transporter substrate-binding protein (plasmid) [Paroceanicella profunda]|uniref:ABC transporter substrate-binding protein n=1 Tax=Paroceanicella profunda TaxID=2579971 RepID=A0A5B8G6C3_9RHOB|nr:TRAP transporter substrate-binding protein DctP [Paroceanicella profunda]QDL94663.1 ABC transporter substrate-binding protein [Paroceanicella profunda]